MTEQHRNTVKIFLLQRFSPLIQKTQRFVHISEIRHKIIFTYYLQFYDTKLFFFKAATEPFNSLKLYTNS